MSKLLFLDVDGVLNKDSGRSAPLDPSLVKLFLGWWVPYRLEVEIVLSSSWRFSDKHKATLRSAGINFRGETPPGRGIRGEEIRSALMHHKSKEYAILDDNSDMLPEQLPHFVQTNQTIGLQPKDLIRVTRILKL